MRESLIQSFDKNISDIYYYSIVTTSSIVLLLLNKTEKKINSALREFMF